MRALLTHLQLDAEMTRCGQFIKSIEFGKNAGARNEDRILKVTNLKEEVTCKRCVKSIEAEAIR